MSICKLAKGLLLSAVLAATGCWHSCEKRPTGCCPPPQQQPCCPPPGAPPGTVPTQSFFAPAPAVQTFNGAPVYGR
jgi:hypothetical protein